MSDQAIDQMKEADATKSSFKDPYEFLATFRGAPSKAHLEALKASTPNGRLRLFYPDTKRVFILRGLSGLELANLQKQIPANMAPANQEQELQFHVGSLATVWSSATPTGKVTAEELRTGSAGLPSSIFQIVSWLSDFMEPQVLEALSVEL